MKPQRRSTQPPASLATLPVRAVEALQQSRFKEAIELLKQLVKQDPSPEWKESLADAYCGRARSLAAKGMFKEAAMVLENTNTQGGTLRDPMLYVACLVRDGQLAKAATCLLQASGEDAALEELTAALLMHLPVLPAPPRTQPPAVAGWHERAHPAREALDAWISGAGAETLEAQLNRISLRSAFRPVRLLLKTLTSRPPDPERSRRLLESITQASPFHPWRVAVEAALRAGPGLDADDWQRLSPTQQAFVAETGGLPVAATQALGRLAEAVRGGPAVLFGWLLKQNDLPQAEIRSACFNLLPHNADRIGQFEKSFGPLSEAERVRVQALAAEARSDWEGAERYWRQLAEIYQDAGDRVALLSAGVIYRHLAQLAHRQPDICGPYETDDPEIYYLERAGEADPEHVPTVLERLEYYRKESIDKAWHSLADEAVQRFPQNSQVLQAAIQSAMARQAYKKAAGFARRLLTIDPINAGVRRQMIELHIAHARKQMRSKRADLAAKELAQAAEWDRADAPSGVLRIVRGLVALSGGDAAQGEAWVREGVALAVGAVVGWFRAVLEAELMKSAGGPAQILRAELAEARKTPPTKAAILAIASALNQPQAGEGKKALSGLLSGMRAWLLAGAELVWSVEEFQTLADMFARHEAYDLLGDYARAARQREPANLEWRFHEIFARTRGNGNFMTMAESRDVEEMARLAQEREDHRVRARLMRFLGIETSRRSRRSRNEDRADLDEASLHTLMVTMVNAMPRGAADDLRSMVREIGRKAALEITVANFRDSKLGVILPEPMLREMCEQMIERATSGRKAQF